MTLSIFWECPNDFERTSLGRVMSASTDVTRPPSRFTSAASPYPPLTAIMSAIASTTVI